MSSDYTVIARRARPQAFAQVIGQDAITQALSNAIHARRIAHAYLFTGPRGTGKTTITRIVARCLNCETGPTIAPCGTCVICQAIMAGEDQDAIEIDGASNRGIEAIRSLRTSIQYRPQRARFKIITIDEVHMLTGEAFNALLKTLEEPPDHVKFLFATTDPQKIPITVLSRCQRFDLQGIAPASIARHLASITASEAMTADPDALALIAQRAQGSMRDAQSLLDQLLSFADSHLSVAVVESLLGLPGTAMIQELAGHLLSGQLASMLAQLHSDLRCTPGELVDQLLLYWRDLLILRSCPDGPMIHFPESHRQTLQTQTMRLSVPVLLAGTDILLKGRQRLREFQHASVILEITLLGLFTCCQPAARPDWAASPFPSLPTVPATGVHAVIPTMGSPTAALVPLSSMSAPGPAAVAPVQPLSGQPAPSIAPASIPLAGTHPVSPSPVMSGTGPVTVHTATSDSSAIFQQVGPLLASKLARAAITRPAPDTVIIAFEAQFRLSRQFCETGSRRRRIRAACTRAMGQPITLLWEEHQPTSDCLHAAAILSLQQVKPAHAMLSALQSMGASVLLLDPSFSCASPEPL